MSTTGLDHQDRREVLFCKQEDHFRIECSLFWEAVKNQSHPKHKLALAAAQNTRIRQAENDLQSIDVTSGELSAKSVKAVNKESDAGEGGKEKRLIGNKLRDSGSRGYHQGEKKTWRQKRSSRS